VKVSATVIKDNQFSNETGILPNYAPNDYSGVERLDAGALAGFYNGA
jgi:hypothetical protein